MTIACYDQDKIIKYNGLIILLAQPKNKTMLLPLSQTHTQTRTQHLHFSLSNFLSIFSQITFFFLAFTHFHCSRIITFDHFILH